MWLLMKKHRLLLALLLATIPTIAQQPKQNYGRYEFHCSERGIFILDSQTGRLFQYLQDTFPPFSSTTPGATLSEIPYRLPSGNWQFSVPTADDLRKDNVKDSSWHAFVDSCFRAKTDTTHHSLVDELFGGKPSKRKLPLISKPTGKDSGSH
jgi:hypothetical protein